jgi:hypothetical protein
LGFNDCELTSNTCDVLSELKYIWDIEVVENAETQDHVKNAMALCVNRSHIQLLEANVFKPEIISARNTVLDVVSRVDGDNLRSTELCQLKGEVALVTTEIQDPQPVGRAPGEVTDDPRDASHSCVADPHLRDLIR